MGTYKLKVFGVGAGKMLHKGWNLAVKGINLLLLGIKPLVQLGNNASLFLYALKVFLYGSTHFHKLAKTLLVVFKAVVHVVNLVYLLGKVGRNLLKLFLLLVKALYCRLCLNVLCFKPAFQFTDSVALLLKVFVKFALTLFRILSYALQRIFAFIDLS